MFVIIYRLLAMPFMFISADAFRWLHQVIRVIRIFVLYSQTFFASCVCVACALLSAGVVKVTGRLHIPGCTRMLLQLDARTNVPAGSMLLVKDSGGRVVTGLGGSITSAATGDTCQWFSSGKHECSVLDHTVTFEFTSHSDGCAGLPTSSFWGFGISAFADTSVRVDDRAARQASYERLISCKVRSEAESQ